MRILLVGSDASDRNATQQLLLQMPEADTAVECVSSRGECVEAIQRAEHDACLVSAGLDGRSAIDTARDMVAGGGNPPIVLLVDEDDDAADDAGAADVLVRAQVTPLLLSRCLRYAVENAGLREAFRLSTESHALVARVSADGIWHWDLESNTAAFSAQWKTILGYGADEIGADPDEWLNRIHPDEVDQVRDDIQAHLNGLTPHFQSQTPPARQAGRLPLRHGPRAGPSRRSRHGAPLRGHLRRHHRDADG